MSSTGREWEGQIHKEAFGFHFILSLDQLASSRGYFWKLFVDLLNYHFVHLALLALLLFHHNALQSSLQVGETVLVLQVRRRPHDCMHQRQVLHS